MGVEDWRVGATQSSGLRGRAKVQLGSEGRGRLHWRMYSEMPCDQLGVEARTGGRAMTQAAEPREPKYSFRTLPLHGRAEGKAWPSRTLSLPDSHTHSHTHTHMHARTDSFRPTQTHRGACSPVFFPPTPASSLVFLLSPYCRLPIQREGEGQPQPEGGKEETRAKVQSSRESSLCKSKAREGQVRRQALRDPLTHQERERHRLQSHRDTDKERCSDTHAHTH